MFPVALKVIWAGYQCFVISWWLKCPHFKMSYIQVFFLFLLFIFKFGRFCRWIHVFKMLGSFHWICLITFLKLSRENFISTTHFAKTHFYVSSVQRFNSGRWQTNCDETCFLTIFIFVPFSHLFLHITPKV